MVRMTTGRVRKYSDAYFISAGRIFLPMYSGVRPTISPATNTVTMARIKMPYMPAPIPPGAISPRAMSSRAMPPPNGVSESWKQFTAPVEVTVVDAAHSEQPGGPNLVSTPSIRAVRQLRGDPGGAQMQLEEADPGHRQPAQMITIDGDQRVTLLVVADHLAEGPGRAERDEQQQEDLEPYS